MIECQFNGIKNILCLGAHSDDVEIGCGATIIKLLRERCDLSIWWIIFTAGGKRAVEARTSAVRFLAGSAKSKVVIKNFRNGFFPFEGARIKQYFESMKARIHPDLVLTHYRNDRHQDHRTISDLTWNTFRDHLILEYEIPKYDGDLGAPNFFVPMNESTCRNKANLILEHFTSQRSKRWFSEDTFLALGRLRGVECSAPEDFAEAFYSRKLTI